jgi:hypothetical protein
MAGRRARRTLAAMYAQLIEGGTTPDRREEMDRIVTDEMVPALHAEPGFAGALNLVDRDSGNALMIVLWDDEAQAKRPLAQYGGAFLKSLASVMGISTGTRSPISYWEVNGDRSPCGLGSLGVSAQGAELPR